MRCTLTARFAFVVVRHFAGCLTLPQEENFASYIFMGSLTQVFVYLGMSAAPLAAIAAAGFFLALVALGCM
jgi:hypothetical protein